MTVGTYGLMGGERRAHARYPVKLALRFLIRTEKVLSISGEGTSLNISSTGMLFSMFGASDKRRYRYSGPRMAPDG